jgi:hypothetical protein
VVNDGTAEGKATDEVLVALEGKELAINDGEACGAALIVVASNKLSDHKLEAMMCEKSKDFRSRRLIEL